jgi:SAM-dependent methyltransferase
MGEWAQYYQAGVSIDDYLANLYTHAPLLEAVLSREPTRVLEVGVGTGGMGTFISQLGPEVVGIDNDLDILEGARLTCERFHGSMRLVEADAFRLAEDLLEPEFDVAYSQGFFEHFDDGAVGRLVEQQLSVARRVVFSVPSDAYPRQDFGNERLLSPTQWSDVLAGLGAVTVSDYGVVRHGRLARLKGKPAEERLHVLAVIDRLD